MKVVGVLCNINTAEKMAALHEFGEPHQPVFIMVHVENLDQYEYLEGRLVTVFGTLDIQRESAYVTARIIRDSEHLSVDQHNSAMASLKKLLVK